MRAQARAHRFEVRHELARLEMRAAVEGHVLDQVREALLVVGFVDRSRFDRKPQRDAIGGPAVLTYVELRPVRQRARVHGRVERHRLLKIERLLRRRCRRLRGNVD